MFFSTEYQKVDAKIRYQKQDFRGGTDYRTGIDIVEWKRFESIVKKYGKRFVGRVYTHEEMKRTPEDNQFFYFALLFSFKEAVWKSLPEVVQKKTYFKDISVLRNMSDYSVFVHGKPFSGASAWSLSGDCVVTVALYCC